MEYWAEFAYRYVRMCYGMHCKNARNLKCDLL